MQTRLFEIGIDKNKFANAILNDLNNLETIWKGTFEIEEVDLSKWSHISDNDKVLSVIYKSNLITDYGADNNFTYFCKYKEDERKLLNIYEYSETLKRYENDKDLCVSITPDMVIVYFHKFERKC